VGSFPIDKKSVLLSLLLIVAVGALLYLPKLTDNIGWYNSGEFVAAAMTKDVPHAPGYPLFTRLNEAMLALPFNAGPAYKLNLLSALIGIVAVAMLLLVLFEAGISAWAALAAASLLLASRTFFEQAILVEVYCLELFFIGAGLMVGLRLAKNHNGNGLAFAAGLVGALGVGHRPTFVLYALALIFFVFERSSSLKELNWRWFCTGIVTGLLPSLDLYFRLQNPQRLLLDPMVGQGLSGFLRVFSGTVYSGGLFSLGLDEVWQRLVYFFGFALSDSSVLVLPLALTAIFIKNGNVPFKKALLLIGMLNLVFVLNYNAFEAHSMLLPCVYAMIALTASVFDAVKQNRLRNAICAVVMISALTGAWFGQVPVEKTPIDYSLRMLKNVPPTAMMLMSNDVEFRPYYYLRLTRGLRQDTGVQLVDAYAEQDLAGLGGILKKRPICGTLIHPANALEALVASFSIACDGYTYRLLPQTQPKLSATGFTDGVTIGRSRVKIDLGVEENSRITAGSAIDYSVDFSGNVEDISNLRVWVFLSDSKNRVILRNGVLVGHDCHEPAQFINRACLGQDFTGFSIKRALVAPFDLKAGNYHVNFFLEKVSHEKKLPDLWQQLENVNQFNIDGYLEVFRLNYGLTQRLPVLAKDAQSLIDSLPEGFVDLRAFSRRLQIETKPDLNL
jgi:hypothetical protein